jgi:hypothetical protein
MVGYLQNFNTAKLSGRRTVLVEYVFSIPGSSTENERLFSVVFDVWAPDKEHMSLETLEAILNVKVNSKLSCSEYYESVKNDKELLSKVQSGDKFKSGAQSSSTQTVQVENDSSESDEGDFFN